jgi:type II secretory pathway pseudopilin PulG
MRLSARSKLDCFGRARATANSQGAVLLEVILALVLFVAAATILTSGMSSSLESVERLRLNTHAADLAVSVLSELQLGIKTLEVGGAQPFETPYEAWTWEIIASPLQSTAEETSPFKRIEVVIRHDDPALVYRLSQVLRLDPNTPGAQEKRIGIKGF